MLLEMQYPWWDFLEYQHDEVEGYMITHDLDCAAGTSFMLSIEIWDWEVEARADGGDQRLKKPIDLTGWTFLLTVRRDPDGPDVGTSAGTVLDVTTGQVHFVLNEAVTIALEHKEHVYQVIAKIPPNNMIRVLARGILDVLPEIGTF